MAYAACRPTACDTASVPLRHYRARQTQRPAYANCQPLLVNTSCPRPHPVRGAGLGSIGRARGCARRRCAGRKKGLRVSPREKREVKGGDVVSCVSDENYHNDHNSSIRFSILLRSEIIRFMSSLFS